MSTRVRFAPSPTGPIHIGNIRTAIFNWLWARHTGGKFLLRIEDTDQERCTPEALATLFDVLDWLDLSADDEPLYQSSRRDHHVATALSLVDQGCAYRLDGGAVVFRIPPHAGDIPGVRDQGGAELLVHADVPVEIDATGIRFAQVSKKGKPVEQQSCLAGMAALKVYGGDGGCVFELEPVLSDIVAGSRTACIERPQRITFERRVIVFNDLVKGELAKPLDGMKDLVIVRADGSPVFHLANVLDDIYQGITHIIRGDDHVENTYRHLFLYHALEKTPPQYAHLPMIVNAAGKPYAKRDGDAYLGEFRDKGYLADALFNYLTLLGWAPGDDREKLTRAETAEVFDLSRVNRAAAQMDHDKLLHLNGLYIDAMDKDVFLQRALAVAHQQPWGRTLDVDEFSAVAELMQSRTKLVTDIAGWAYFFTDEFEYNHQAVQKHLQRDGIAAALTALVNRLEMIEFDETAIEQAIHETTEECGIKKGKLNLPVRIAVTGIDTGAGVYEIIALLTKERVLRRLRTAAAAKATG